jgi:hypothetical protein
MVPRQNVRRPNVRRDKTSGEKTSGDLTCVRQNVRITKRPAGQNVRWDKMSGRTKRPATKRPAGQNVQRDKPSGRTNVLLQIFVDQHCYILNQNIPLQRIRINTVYVVSHYIFSKSICSMFYYMYEAIAVHCPLNYCRIFFVV